MLQIIKNIPHNEPVSLSYGALILPPFSQAISSPGKEAKMFILYGIHRSDPEWVGKREIK
jgi:hypothetical protein